MGRFKVEVGAGRLTGLVNSKGERTTGRMARIVNARADGSLVSRFTYTYDTDTGSTLDT